MRRFLPFRRVAGVTGSLALAASAFAAPPTSQVSSQGSVVENAPGVQRLAWFCPRPNDRAKVDLAPGVYTPRNGYWFSWMSLQGYSAPGSFRKLERAGFTETTLIADRETSLKGFVASTPEFTAVSFSGSADVKDWVNDLTFRQVDDERWGVPGRIHKGFAYALDGQWPDIALEIVRQSSATAAQGGAPKPIFITGHSLGGAMAILTAARLEAMGIPVAGLYTYAAPRVGDHTFVSFLEDRMNGRMWRFNNNEDIIPRLAPVADAADDFARLLPESLGQSLAETFREARYAHAGHLFRFDAKGTVSGPFSEDPNDERTYWRTIYDRSEGKDLMEKILVNLRAALDHIPAASYCSFNRPTLATED